MMLCPPEEVPEIVANAIGADADFMRHAFDSLNRAGMIDRRPLSGAAFNAAKLVVAGMTCDSPFVADHLVSVYSGLPAIKMASRDKRLALDPHRHSQPIEDVPILAGSGQGWNALTRNFVSAVAALIREVALHPTLTADVFPHRLSARHSARAPMASIRFAPAGNSRPKQICFQSVDHSTEPYLEIGERLVTISKIPGVALCRLASALYH